MKEIFLLGAGASVEENVPGAYKMTQKMLESFETDYRLKKESLVLKYVAGGLLFQAGIDGSNPFDGLNIEDLFNAVQALENRNSLEASVFVSAWHPKISDLEKHKLNHSDIRQILNEFYSAIARGLENNSRSTQIAREFDDKLTRFLADSLSGRHSFDSPGKQLENSLVTSFQNLSNDSNTIFIRQIEQLYNKITNSEEGGIFKSTSRNMINQLIKMVWKQEHSELSYLKPLISHAKENNSIIATLNYDNTIELAAQSLKIGVNSGIEAWKDSGLVPDSSENLLLLKLHGSIDWFYKNQKSSDSSLYYETIEVVDDPTVRVSNYYSQPALIFGQRNKLTTKGPFLDLLSAFKRALSSTDLLTVIGYSFRDAHINEYILKWLKTGATRQLRIINGKSFSENPTVSI